VAADCDDDVPFFLVESLTKTRVLLFDANKKHVSTPTFMPGDVTVCREYQHEACCTLDTVRKCVVVVVLFIVFFFLLLFAKYSIVRSWKLTRARVLFFARF